MILKYPPPANFLNFTRAKSGSMPVVSQSMTRPMVPVGAMHGDLGIAETVLLAQFEHAVAVTAGGLEQIARTVAGIDAGRNDGQSFVLFFRGGAGRLGDGCG